MTSKILFAAIGISALIIYASITNIYFLIMAFKLNDDIRKSGQQMESDVLSCLSWKTNFWNEAAALCENQELLKVLDYRMPLFVIWCFLIVTFMLVNILFF